MTRNEVPERLQTMSIESIRITIDKRNSTMNNGTPRARQSIDRLAETYWFIRRNKLCAT